MKRSDKSQAGIAILISILLVGVLLSMVFSLSAIFIPKTHSASDIKNSVAAAYAAESALEWCFYKYQKDPGAAALSMGNGATYTVIPADCSSTPINATGTFRGVNRAFQIF